MHFVSVLCLLCAGIVPLIRGRLPPEGADSIM